MFNYLRCSTSCNIKGSVGAANALEGKNGFMENFSLIMNSLLLQEIDRILAIMRKKSEQKN